MEKSNIAPVLLSVSSVALAIAVGVLVVKVGKAAPEPDLDPAELARAQAASRRMQSPKPPTSSSSPARTAKRKVVRPPAEDDRMTGAAWFTDKPPKKEIGDLGPAGLAGAAAGGAVSPADSQVDLRKKRLEATRLYDRGDYDGAYTAVAELLEETPSDVKLLRIAASSACIMGDATLARGHYDLLPPRDQRQIGRRCVKYGIEF